MRLTSLAVVLAVIPLTASFAQSSQTPAAPAGKMPAGHPSFEQMQPAGKAEMKHTGTVQEILAASPYIYIHVNGAEGDQWLAAPSIDLKKGATIRWPDGMPMNGWFSKSLNRKFDTVYFVTGVEPAGK